MIILILYDKSTGKLRDSTLLDWPTYTKITSTPKNKVAYRFVTVDYKIVKSIQSFSSCYLLFFFNQAYTNICQLLYGAWLDPGLSHYTRDAKSFFSLPDF